MPGENRGLLHIGGETINLKDESPAASICKDAASSSDDDCAKWYVKFWRREKLMIFIIVGVLLGFTVGIACNGPIQNLEEPTRSTVLSVLGFPGEIFMRMLKMLILPLIVSSLIVGVAELDQRASGRLGLRAIAYYMLTTLLAVVLGIILVVAIHPGSNAGIVEQKSSRDVRAIDSFMDLIRNMFPENLIQACISSLATNVKQITIGVENITISNMSALTEIQKNDLNVYTLHTSFIGDKNGTNVSTWWYTRNITDRIAGDAEYKGGTNILGLVVFSLAVGCILGKMGKRAATFIEWMNTLNDVVMQLVSIVMWYSPVGIWSLIAEKFARMHNISGAFEGLALYMVTVIVGLIIHSCFTLPLIYFISTRKSPLQFVKGIVQALLTAFGTSSSSATLPVTFRCLEDVNRIDKRVTRFVLPIGATINMDGTALYEAVGAIFIAQASGMSLNLGQYIAVSLTSTLASIGAAGIPQAGVVTMMIVLQTIGLPEDAVGLILAVDWFLDRIRTTVNVLGDAFGAGIVAHLSEDDLRDMDIYNAEQARLELESGLLSPQVNVQNVNLEDNTTTF